MKNGPRSNSPVVMGVSCESTGVMWAIGRVRSARTLVGTSGARPSRMSGLIAQTRTGMSADASRYARRKVALRLGTLPPARRLWGISLRSPRRAIGPAELFQTSGSTRTEVDAENSLRATFSYAARRRAPQVGIIRHTGARQEREFTRVRLKSSAHKRGGRRICLCHSSRGNATRERMSGGKPWQVLGQTRLIGGGR
jgi:hypothetical protein